MKDRYGREISYLRLSVTDRCNLRCRYCMPPEGVPKRRHEEMLTEEETVMAVETAAELGIRKLRITGGEPLVKKNILSLCRKVSAVPGIQETCLTTNGILLPQYAGALKEAGVERLNISLDTLDPGRYAAITCGGRLQDALDGIEAALQAGFSKVKINAVLIGGFNDDEIAGLAELTRRWPADVRFIELMPTTGQSAFPESAFLPGDTVKTVLPELTYAGSGEGPAEHWKLPGAQGRIGLICPVRRPFCSSCSRLRLTADGKLKPCLHSAEEYSIKGLSGEDMRKQFIRAIQNKPERHGDLSRTGGSGSRRGMNRIGG